MMTSRKNSIILNRYTIEINHLEIYYSKIYLIIQRGGYNDDENKFNSEIKITETKNEKFLSKAKNDGGKVY